MMTQETEDALKQVYGELKSAWMWLKNAKTRKDRNEAHRMFRKTMEEFRDHIGFTSEPKELWTITREE